MSQVAQPDPKMALFVITRDQTISRSLRPYTQSGSNCTKLQFCKRSNLWGGGRIIRSHDCDQDNTGMKLQHHTTINIHVSWEKDTQFKYHSGTKTINTKRLERKSKHLGGSKTSKMKLTSSGFCTSVSSNSSVCSEPTCESCSRSLSPLDTSTKFSCSPEREKLSQCEINFFPKVNRFNHHIMFKCWIELNWFKY